MASEMVRQDQLANDLANASTPGYKADRTTQRSFGEVLLQNSTDGAQVGSLGLGVVAERTVTDLRPEGLRNTGEDLDFGVQGEGYFAVRSPQGVRYTRNGQFARSAQGTLVTALGSDVLDQNGNAIQVGADGKVDAAKLGLFSLSGARKVGDNLFAGAPGGRAQGSVRSGSLEASGVDPTRAMVDMLASLRAFESGQRVITTIDSTLQKAANQVASTSG
jgi:flagellar basal-body rod protein FlgG